MTSTLHTSVCIPPDSVSFHPVVPLLLVTYMLNKITKTQERSKYSRNSGGFSPLGKRKILLQWSSCAVATKPNKAVFFLLLHILKCHRFPVSMTLGAKIPTQI